LEEIRAESWPNLANPTMIAAYKGWNDAGNAATYALEYIISQTGATMFASIDPDEFYDFTQVRPYTRPIGDYGRVITWTPNNFYYAHISESKDYVFFVGTEPNLRWRRYSSLLVKMANRLGVKEVISLGSMLADTPHTRPVPLSGGASSPELGEKLRSLGINSSFYEGPTGIVSVAGLTLAESGIQHASIWASVPHYISASPNPKAALALVDSVERLTGLRVSVDRLQMEAITFESQVDAAVSDNPDIEQYVRELEQRVEDQQNEDTQDEGAPEGYDASEAEGLIRSIEEYLRQQSQNRNKDDEEDQEEDNK